MADNSGIHRHADGQGNMSSSGPPQVELQLEESSFDLLVQDREDGRPEHQHRPSLVGLLSLDATPAPRPITSTLAMQGSLENRAPSVPPTLMSTSNQASLHDAGIPRSSLPAPPLLPEIPQSHPHIIDIISDFDSDDLSSYRTSGPRPNVVLTPPVRPRAPSPPPISSHRSSTAAMRPLIDASDSLSIVDLSVRMRQLSERLEALSERAGDRRRSSGFTNSSGLLGPPRRAPQRASISATSSSRSPELPPIDVSEGLTTLTSMLTLDNHHTPRHAGAGLDASRNRHSHPREESRAHSSSIQPPTDARSSSPASASWDYAAERARHQAFEEAIAVIRPTPPPLRHPPRLPDPLIGGEPLSSSLRPLASRRISRASVNPRPAIWSQSSSQVSSPTSQSVPTLPPISAMLSRSLGAMTADMDLSDGSWEEEEEPSQWLRETRRVLGRSADGNRRARSASPPPPVLQLPNFSTASLGLGDYHHGHPPASPVRSTRTRQSADSLRHALRAQRRSQSILSALGADDRLLPLPASPPAISDDEPFERAVLAELESRMTQPEASTSHNHSANTQRPNHTNTNYPRGSRPRQSPTGIHRTHHHAHTARAGPSNANHPPPITDDSLDLEPMTPTREFARVLQDRLRTREGPGDLALLPDLMEELERYTTERAEPVRLMRRALARVRSPDGEDSEEREAPYQRRTPQHTEPVGNRRRRLLSVRLPDEEDSEDQPSSGFETIITRRRVDTTTSTTSNGTPSGGFRRTFERRRRVDVMVGRGQLSPSESEQDGIWPIPDLDYSSTDEMFNLTREIQELEQYVLERGPARVSDLRRRRINSNLRANTLGDFVSDVVFDNSYEALMDLGEQIGAVPRGLPPHITSALPSKTFGELDPSFIAQSPLAASTPLSPPSKGKATVRTVKVQCSICLDEFTKYDLCITLECAHFFHQNCVLQWFRGASTCPLCRRPVIPGN